MVKPHLYLSALVVSAAALFSAPAGADTSVGQLAIAAMVPQNCKVNVLDLPFGTYDPLMRHAAASLDAASSLTVTCTKNTSLRILLGGGENAGNAGPRRMAQGDQKLAYQLFRDPSRNQVWGSGESGVSLPGTRGARAPEVLTIYGRIPPGQVVLAGRYTDTVVATLEF